MVASHHLVPARTGHPPCRDMGSSPTSVHRLKDLTLIHIYSPVRSAASAPHQPSPERAHQM
eukprot:7007-Eustigmatos_ZCMA.PRE.1